MARSNKKARYLVTGFVLLLLVLGVSACGSDSDTTSSGSETSAGGDSGSSSGETYTIYLNINGTFNSWRTQMQHTVEFAAENPPLKDKVDFKFVSSPEDLSGQAKDLNSIIAARPDAILLDSASATGLNAQVEKACAAGIAVISYDNVVTTPCAYKITIPIKEGGELLAQYIGEKLDGKGEVVVDRGLAGASIADELYAGYTEGLKKFPGIEVVGTMESKYTPGLVKSQLGSLLAANPNLSAILIDIYGVNALQAFEAANIDPVPIITGSITSGDVAACEKAQLDCASASVPPYLAAEALKFAVELLEGKADESQKEVLLDTPFLFTEPPAGVPGFENAIIEKAKPISGVSPETVLPTAPKWLDITPQEATGS